MTSDKLKRTGVSIAKWAGSIIGPVILTALIKGEPLAGLTTIPKLARFLRTSVPLWLLLVAVLVIAWILPGFIQSKAKPGGPKLHVSWDRQQCFWHKGAVGLVPAMQIVGWAVVSSSDTDERIILREAYVKGTRPVISALDIVVEPGKAVKTQISTFVQPVILDENAPLRTRVIIRDHQNREYVTPENIFRATPTPQRFQPPTPKQDEVAT